jgi:cysteine synthase
MALATIEGAERDGLISAGDTVVEYTGGSTGPAVALVCRPRDIAVESRTESTNGTTAAESRKPAWREAGFRVAGAGFEPATFGL